MGIVRSTSNKIAGIFVSLATTFGIAVKSAEPVHAQEAFDELASSSPLSLIFGKGLKSQPLDWQEDIADALEDNRTSGPPLKKLQRLLVQKEFLKNSRRAVDGRMGHKTAGAIIKFLQEYPDAVIGMSYSYKRHLLNNGYGKKLREILAKHEAALSGLKKGGATKNALRQKVETYVSQLHSLNSSQIKDLQGSLKFLGCDPGKIDGKVGPATKRAIKACVGKEVGPSPYALKPPKADHVEGDNGFGISNRSILAAWSKVSGSGVNIAPPKTKELDGQTIFVFDPGHGWKSDMGALSDNNIPETGLIDISASALATALHEKGLPAVFTRDPGHRYRSGVSRLSSRPDFAKALKKVTGAKRVIFISIHADWARRAGASGSRIFTRRGLKKDHPSAQLAETIQANYSISGRSTRLKKANFAVLRGISKNLKDIPAVLLELGFVTNTGDVKNLLDKKAQKRRMESLADSLSQMVRELDSTVSKRAQIQHPMRKPS
ncbi:MAG: N-acetylmuramoyl-L-alanine amidase [Alphaproteobacteria bacterium]|nr:N-acetylmuramoyl-L-alanine amidase [Alphaproteobacteria bacterium]